MSQKLMLVDFTVRVPVMARTLNVAIKKARGILKLHLPKTTATVSFESAEEAEE